MIVLQLCDSATALSNYLTPSSFEFSNYINVSFNVINNEYELKLDFKSAKGGIKYQHCYSARDCQYLYNSFETKLVFTSFQQGKLTEGKGLIRLTSTFG